MLPLAKQRVLEIFLVIPVLAHLSQSEQWLVWIAPPHLPYGPARPRGIDFILEL